MSSIIARPNGHHWIAYSHNSKRHTVRLGKAPRGFAEAFQKKLDLLIHCRQFGVQPDAELAAWLFNLGDRFHKNLVQSRLADPRGPAYLGELLEAHEKSLTARKVQESTLCNNRISHGNLRQHFGETRRIDTIKLQDAEGFLFFLSEKGGRHGGPLAEATVSNRIRRARAVFAYAVNNHWLKSNPFAKVLTGSEVNVERDCYVPYDFFERVLSFSADKELRLLLALVRYCGLRCPSEIQPLTWQSVDRDKGVLVVYSPKTKKHRWRREVPIFSAVVPYLDEAYEAAPHHTPLMFPRHQGTGVAITNRLGSLCRKADEALWSKPMVNLRASCEHDLIAARYTINEVAEWLGHSPSIAIKHYSRVAKELESRSANSALRVDWAVIEAKRNSLYDQVPIRPEPDGAAGRFSTQVP